MEDIFTVIIASGIISTIISTAFSFLVNKNNNNLQYIINERKAWRSEIRMISEEIYSASQFNIGGILVRLKVRINAFGKLDVNDWERDSHIWLVIRVLEITKSHDEFVIYKSKLIELLSLLLKYDWERAKREVRGNTLIFFEIALLCFSGCMYIVLYFFIWKLNFNISFISCFILIGMIINSIYDKEGVNISKARNDKLYISRRSTIQVIKMLIILGILSIEFYNTYSLIERDISSYLGEISIINYSLLIWFIIWRTRFNNKLNFIKEYLNSITKTLE
jgi:hypothetical protein